MVERISASLLSRRTDQTIVAGWRDPAMQRVTDTLRSGLTWYVHGRLPLRDATRLVAKFQERFPQLKRDRRHAHRQKLAGAPRYKLITFANRQSLELLFWLLTDRPTNPREKWQDATGADRVPCYQYEAVQHTREGFGEPAWSWGMTVEHFDRIKAELRIAIRENLSHEAKRIGDDSAKWWPGFGVVRQQRKVLHTIYRHEWKRKFRSSSEPPAWPRLSYVDRLPTR